MDSSAKTFVVDDNPEIVMRSNLGQVTVVAGEPRYVSIEARDRGIRLPLFGKWSIRKLEVVDSQTGSRLDVEVKFPQLQHYGGLVLPISSVCLTVPPRAVLDINTGDGKIFINEVEGSFRLMSCSGSIEATLNGDLEAIARNGSIRATGNFGLMRLHSNSGDVAVDVAPASHARSEWRVTTWNGDIRFRCPSDFAAVIDAEAGGGRVLVDSSRNSVYKAEWNGGGPLVQLRCTNGNIRIFRV